MRFAALVLLLIAATVPALSAKRVTVEQLEQILSTDGGKRDRTVAHQIAGLELTERLSSAMLLRLEVELPGSKSRQSLELLADLSVFLDPPAGPIEQTAAPDLAEERRIISLAIEYAGKTMRKLPNFFATRTTVFYEDTPPGRRADLSLIPYDPIHQVSNSSDTVLYRDGGEVVDSGKAKRKPYNPTEVSLITRGVFGQLMGTALIDAAHGSVRWSRWEQGDAGPEAVFRYAVPRAQSHYEVEFCCFTDQTGRSREFKKISGYHGEMAVDPANGSILRLTVVADLERTDPVTKSNILVEYGPVEIGGRSYVCPLKSISMWVAPVPEPNALQTLLTNAAFTQYHLFRSESRVLIGNEVAIP